MALSSATAWPRSRPWPGAVLSRPHPPQPSGQLKVLHQGLIREPLGLPEGVGQKEEGLIAVWHPQKPGAEVGQSLDQLQGGGGAVKSKAEGPGRGSGKGQNPPHNPLETGGQDGVGVEEDQDLAPGLRGSQIGLTGPARRAG